MYAGEIDGDKAVKFQPTGPRSHKFSGKIKSLSVRLLVEYGAACLKMSSHCGILRVISMKENLDFRSVSVKIERSRVSGRAGKLLVGSPAPRDREFDPTNATILQVEIDFRPVGCKMGWSRVSGRAGKLFAGSPAPRHRVLGPANVAYSQFERAVFCRDNSLTKGVHSVSNFSAQCNERLPNNGPIPISEQNETQILLLIGVCHAPDRVLDLCIGDTPWSLRGTRKNLGYKCQPEISTKGGVACRDDSGIVSPESELGRVDYLHSTPNPQGNPRSVSCEVCRG